MAVPFARSTRSLNADKFRFSLVGLVLAMLLLGGWCLWFFFAQITLFASSQEAQVVEGELIVALFPKEDLHRIVRGQHARFQPDGVALDAGGVACLVTEVGRNASGQGLVQLAVLHQQLQVPVAPDATGQVDIEVGQLSPAKLVLQAMGLSGDGKKSLSNASLSE